MNPIPSCEYLPWDSECFGCRIGRITAERVSPELLPAIEVWCRQERIDCIYFLAGLEDTSSIHIAEQNDYHLMDIRMTLGCRTSPPPPPDHFSPSILLRPAESKDVQVLCALAATNHQDTRFYQDQHFPRERCAHLYAVWIEKSCHGYADTVLVAEREGQVAGYITALKTGPEVGQIGLCGVASEARGLGLGRLLVLEALRWFSRQNVSQSTVVTQGRNLAALRLYQRCGFSIHRVQLWYHRWFRHTGANTLP